MELEKSQLNWVYCYLDSRIIHFPLGRSYLRHLQRCRVKIARRFQSRFASLRPEWRWWRRPRRCATRRSRWPICNPLQHHHHHPHHHYQGRGDHSSNDHNWSSSHQSCKEARWEIFFRLLSKRSFSENSEPSVPLVFIFNPPSIIQRVPLDQDHCQTTATFPRRLRQAALWTWEKVEERILPSFTNNDNFLWRSERSKEKREEAGKLEKARAREEESQREGTEGTKTKLNSRVCRDQTTCCETASQLLETSRNTKYLELLKYLKNSHPQSTEYADKYTANK